MKSFLAFVFISIITVMIAAPAFAADDVHDIADIRLLRKMGMHEEARGYLLALKNDAATSESVLRQVYAELAAIAWLTGGKEPAETAAREALERYYDIEIDKNEYPAEVASIFDDLRRRLFCETSITSDPAGANLRVDDRRIGNTPVTGLMLPPGDHVLKLTMTGFKDEVITISVARDKSNDYTMTLREDVHEAARYGFGFGIEAGLSLESLSYANQEGNFMGMGGIASRKGSLRMTGGLFAQIMRSDQAGIVLRGRYANYGERVTLDDSRVFDVEHHSLALAAFFKYYLLNGPRIFVTVGPEFAFILSSKLSPEEQGEDIDLGEFVKSDQLFFDIGAGVEFPLSRYGAGVAINYALGMFDMKAMESYELVNYKPREFRVTAFFLFR